MVIKTPVRDDRHPKDIVRSLHPSVEWESETVGYIECPGKNLHTTGVRKKECRVAIDGAPTIFCLHQSCTAAVAAANLELRRALSGYGAGATSPAPIVLTPEQRAAMEARRQQKEQDEKLRKWATESKSRILAKYAWTPEQAWEDSPIKSDSPEGDFPLFLSLFDEGDWLWVGEPYDSGEGSQEHFMPCAAWRTAGPRGHFTCPSTFGPTTISRANGTVVKRKFLVIESDTLSQPDTCALAKWLTRFMVLRMMVFSGGKSIHCWFQTPSEELFRRLKIVLPEMGCDPALFKPSQPVRVPGVKRGEKWQNIIFFQKGLDYSNQS